MPEQSTNNVSTRQTGVNRILKGHKNHVQSVCFSPDGKLIASGSMDRTIKIWDAQNGLEFAHSWEIMASYMTYASVPMGSRSLLTGTNLR